MRYFLALCGLIFCLSAQAKIVSFTAGQINYAYDTNSIQREDGNVTVILVTDSPLLNVEKLKDYAAGLMVITIGCSSNEFLIDKIVVLNKDSKPLAVYTVEGGAQEITTVSVPAYLARNLCAKEVI